MLSVIIPTLNESATLERTITWTRRAAGGSSVELIVSDCNSPDGTAELAGRLGVTVVRGGISRADALNRGAAAAKGKTLLFLHADSIAPEGFARIIAKALARPGTVGGAFDFRFDRQGLRSGYDRQALKLVVLCNRVRFRWTRNYYGDQGIFVLRDVYRRIGGFPKCGLMEDLRFCQRLNCLGRTVIVSPAMKTSPRRFVQRGVLRQLGQDLLLLGCESVGFSPEWIWARYNGLNHRSR